MSIIHLGKHSFQTLVAITPEEHSMGLMHKPWPPPVMVFPYNKAEERKFWMKNTISPLDIVFCRDNKIVDICYGEPMSTKLIGPNEPSDMVIELPFGTVHAHQLKRGDPIKFAPSKEIIGKDIGRLFREISGRISK